MQFGIPILAAVVATLTMTAFSHLTGTVIGMEFNEAHLLNRVFSKARGGEQRKLRDNDPRGWLVHLIIGWVLAVGLRYIFLCPTFAKFLWVGSIFGIVAGLLGVAGWSIMFKKFGVPEGTGKRSFFLQLIGAHIVFATTCFAVFTLYD